MNRLTRWRSPTATGPELLEYQHPKLKSINSMRLVKIKPGIGNKGIAIDLVDSFVCSAGRQPFEEYDALSYTWGDVTQEKTILCNGRRLTITNTLLEALRHFRDPDKEVTLWIDQICICQSRVLERNQQVQMMGRIFTGARKVLVWLGGHYDDSRAGMQLAQQLLSICRSHNLEYLGTDQFESYGLPSLGHKRWRALTAILHRPWFRRTWIIQEVVLNPNVVLVLADTLLRWEDLEAIVDLLEGPLSVQWQHDLTMSALELPFSRINRIRLYHKRVQSEDADRNDPDVQPMDDELDDDLELLDLLLMSRDLGATDPRDKVYALLGLARHEMVPDYTASCSPEHVFNEFALHVVGQLTKLASPDCGNKLSSTSSEARRALVMLACAGRPNQQRKLPSWTPDWTASLKSRPLVFDSRFRAGGDVIEMDWNPDTGLQLAGRLLDTVVIAGSVNLQYDPEMIAPWWEEAKLIANSRAVRSPGSTGHMDAFRALRRDICLNDHGHYQPDNPLSPNPEHRPRRRRSLLDESELATNQEIHSDARQTLTLGPTRGRVLFCTTTGWIGLAPYGAQEGDLVYIVLGASVPFLLRPIHSGGGFILIGETYVQGVMGGEILAMDQVSGLEDLYIK